MSKKLALTKTLKQIVGIMGNFTCPLQRMNVPGSAGAYSYIFGKVTGQNITKLKNRNLIQPVADTVSGKPKLNEKGKVIRYELSSEGWEAFNALEKEFTTFPTKTLLILSIEKSGSFEIEEREVYVKGTTTAAVNVHDNLEATDKNPGGTGYRVLKTDIEDAVLIKDNIDSALKSRNDKTGTARVVVENDNVATGRKALEDRVRKILESRLRALKAFMARTENSLKQLNKSAVVEPVAPVVEKTEAPAEENSEAPAEENPEVKDVETSAEEISNEDAPAVEDENSDDSNDSEEKSEEEVPVIED